MRVALPTLFPAGSQDSSRNSREGIGASPATANLTALTTRGGLYLGLRYGLGIVVSFANMLVLTRWIGPHAYGLFVCAGAQLVSGGAHAGRDRHLPGACGIRA